MSKGTAARARNTRRLILAYLGAQIDEVHAREPGARIDSPDAVHRMRVATRRLRSSLATFGPLLQGPETQRLRDELQWLGTVLGPVRDVEVMRAHLHATAAILAVDAALADVLAGLDHELAERHSQAHQGLVTAMNSTRYAALLATLAAFVTDPPWVAEAATRHTLPALVGRACARVDRAARAAENVFEAGGVELHEVRKAAKRARYAAEVAVPTATAALALAERMEELQEVLGQHQDSLMVRALIQDLATRMTEHEAFALGLLTGVEQTTDDSVLRTYRLALAAASTDEVRDWARQ